MSTNQKVKKKKLAFLFNLVTSLIKKIIIFYCFKMD